MLTVVIACMGHAFWSYPNGVTTDCNTDGPTIPSAMLHQHKGYAGNITCESDGSSTGACTLCVEFSIKGFIISSNTTLLSGSTSKQGKSNHCLTHTNNSPKTCVDFRYQGKGNIWAVVVDGKAGVIHSLYLVPPTIVGFDGTVYIVGAGPGGISAARYLRDLGISVHLFERGPDLPTSFYSDAISTTDLQYVADTFPTRTYYPLGESFSPKLASQVGGNQNANGAIYSPGTAEDLSASVGVSLYAAQRAQATVADYLYVSRKLLMMKCIDNTDCDYATISSANTKMSRTSVAQNHSLGSRLSVSTSIAFVSDDFIQFTNGSRLMLETDDKIILAAGALSTPQLVNQTSFCGYNHYYDVSTEIREDPPSVQTITYDPVNKVETNTAIYSMDGQTITLIIRMLMEHDIQECFQVGQSNEVPQKAADLGYSADAWHYMGTIKHVELQYSERIFIGDASAIRTPFNCHTSMPAAAVGVMAAQKSIGTLPQPSTPDKTSGAPGLNRVGPIFSTGTLLIVVAVVLHWVSNRVENYSVWYRWSHYMLAFSGVVVLTAGVLVAKSGDGMVKAPNKGHFGAGYFAILWLWIQALGGAVLVKAESKDWTKSRVLHRISGALLLVLIIYIFLTVALKQSPFHSMQDIRVWEVITWTVISIIIVTLGLVFKGFVNANIKPVQNRIRKTPSKGTGVFESFL